MSEIRVDDEEAFMGYAEKFVYDLQKAWAGKKGFEGYAVCVIGYPPSLYGICVLNPPTAWHLCIVYVY